MSINLQKGQKIDLTKPGQGLKGVMVGLGWDEAKRSFFSRSQTIDCDASVILLGEDGKLVSRREKEYLVYFGNLRHSSGAIIHQGDNLTGEGDGDDEEIMVNLPLVPQNIARLVFVVNIYDAGNKKQHFGMIQNAFIRLVNMDTMQEICRYDLSEKYDGMEGLIVAEIYRYGGEWKFNAIGQPVQRAGNLDYIVSNYR